MSDTNVKMVCACSRCGSLQVQITAWLEANSDRIEGEGEDGPSESTWCPACEDDTGYEYRAGTSEELAIWDHQKLVNTLQALNRIRPDLLAPLARELEIDTLAAVLGGDRHTTYAARQAFVANRKCEACDALCNDPDWRSCHECGHVLGETVKVLQEPESVKAEGFGVEVTIYRSTIDGTPVVELDTFEDVTTPDGAPKVRVFLNDGEIYENPSLADVIQAQERAEMERES